jgi:hypothetical protein
MESETRALNSWQRLPETRISSVEFRTSLTRTFSSVGINEILSVQFMDARNINSSHNWKSPGGDQIHNFWLKKITCIHKCLFDHFNGFISGNLTHFQSFWSMV